jgi:arylsulfatase A-like enzyme
MPDRPNILLIITDHQAFYAHDRPGEYDYKWPRYEQFCSQGVRFDRAYSVCPICTPARASMMTGQYPSRHGMVWNTGYKNSGNISDFGEDQLLYSHHLSQAGYRNAYVGKWHCGHDKLPVDYGVEGWSLPGYGLVYMSDEYRAYADSRGLGPARALWEHAVDHPEREGQTIVLHDPCPWTFMNASGVMVGPPAAHEEQFVVHLAVEKLRELAKSDQPWSLVASFWGPHHAYLPTEDFAALVDPSAIPEYPSFRDDLNGRPLRHSLHRDFNHVGARRLREWSTWQEILARCYAQGLQLDAAIGTILDALDESGEAENTLVIWCADHGDAVASHGGLWDKASTYTEEVARVPMAVRWPAAFGGERRVGELVSNMDVTATMLAAAGVAVPEDMSSRSVLPLCSAGGDCDWPDVLICEHNGHCEEILQRIAIRGQYKYVAALFDGDELYDLEQDPYEMHNLIDSASHKDVKEGLRSRIIEHIETTSDRRARHLAYSLKKGF